MSHGPTKYPPKNRCIYCGRDGVRLTDEHIVPFSLGGQHVLQSASCLECADITKKFEQDVARDLWGDARASYGAPTRRKKDRKTEQVLSDPSGIGPDLVVPINQYPGILVFYFMGPAGILVGAPEDEDRSPGWELKAVVDEERLQALHKAHPGRVTARFKHVPESFARMLAKIGYCQVLSSLDVGDFTPLCLPYILGQEKNLSYLVGTRTSIDAPRPGVGYSLNSLQFGTNDKRILVAEIRLFADNHTPTYHVVVGEVIGAERVQVVEKKLEAFCTAVIPDGVAVPDNPPDEFHWTPRVWPLPHWN